MERKIATTTENGITKHLIVESNIDTKQTIRITLKKESLIGTEIGIILIGTEIGINLTPKQTEHLITELIEQIDDSALNSHDLRTNFGLTPKDTGKTFDALKTQKTEKLDGSEIDSDWKEFKILLKYHEKNNLTKHGFRRLVELFKRFSALNDDEITSEKIHASHEIISGGGRQSGKKIVDEWTHNDERERAILINNQQSKTGWFSQDEFDRLQYLNKKFIRKAGDPSDPENGTTKDGFIK